MRARKRVHGRERGGARKCLRGVKRYPIVALATNVKLAEGKDGVERHSSTAHHTLTTSGKGASGGSPSKCQDVSHASWRRGWCTAPVGEIQIVCRHVLSTDAHCLSRDCSDVLETKCWRSTGIQLGNLVKWSTTTEVQIGLNTGHRTPMLLAGAHAPVSGFLRNSTNARKPA